MLVDASPAKMSSTVLQPRSNQFEMILSSKPHIVTNSTVLATRHPSGTASQSGGHQQAVSGQTVLCGINGHQTDGHQPTFSGQIVNGQQQHTLVQTVNGQLVTGGSNQPVTGGGGQTIVQTVGGQTVLRSVDGQTIGQVVNGQLSDFIGQTIKIEDGSNNLTFAQVENIFGLEFRISFRGLNEVSISLKTNNAF